MRERIGTLFLDHPRSVGESYMEHASFAAGFSAKLLAAGIAAMIHAFVPALFEKTASRIVAELYEKTRNRG